MLSRHRSQQRAAFVTLLSRADDDTGLSVDSEFRAALLGYLTLH